MTGEIITKVMSGYIELDRDPEVTKAEVLRQIGHMFAKIGRTFEAQADNPDIEIPTIFRIDQYVLGWDMKFLIVVGFDPPTAKEPVE